MCHGQSWRITFTLLLREKEDEEEEEERPSDIMRMWVSTKLIAGFLLNTQSEMDDADKDYVYQTDKK